MPTPADGAEGVPTDTWPHVEMPGSDDAELVVYANGQEMPGTVSWTDGRVTFGPDSWYLPSEAGIDVWLLRPECADARVSSFTTSRYGEPYEEGCLDGKVFAVDVLAGDMVLPVDDSDGLFDDFDSTLLIRVNWSDSDQMQATAAVAETDPLAQDMCSPTVELPMAHVNNPRFSTAASRITLDVHGFDVNLYDVELSGFFSPTCDETGDGTVLARVGVSMLDALAGGDFCALAASVGMPPCEPCPQGAEQCQPLEVHAVTGQVVDVPVVDVSEEQADNCDP